MPAQRTPTVRERVLMIRPYHPDATYAELARMVGCTASAVSKALNPDRAREYNRKGNSGVTRNAAKRAWELAPENRHACVECGHLMGVRRRSSGMICKPCLQAEAGARLAARIEVIRELRYLGLNNREISYETGIHPFHVSNVAQIARERGLDMPRSPSPVGPDPQVGLNGWGAVRARVLHRDNYVCVRGCGRSAEHVHHVKPRADGGTDDEWNLISLCADCHKIEHGLTPRRVAA